MKKIFTITLLSLIFTNAFAGAGYWDSFSIVNAKASGNSYYDLSAVTGNSDFNGADMGSFTLANHSLILGGQIKTWKNDGTNVTGTSIFYRIYPLGSPSGTYEQINYWFQYDNWGGTSGNQRWGTDIAGDNTQDRGIEILVGKTLSSGSYTLEVYAQINTNGINAAAIIYDNAGGSNYKATFTLTESVPVELTSFLATAKGQLVNLNWQTATEINNYGFEVEKRQTSNVKSETWTSIGFVNGHGNSNSPKHYSFTDKDVASGNYSYRLKQIDNDGKYEYSKEVEVVINTAPSEFELRQNYPNPFNPSTNIKYSLPNKEFVSLKVFNVLGNEVASLVNEMQEAGSYKVEFNSASIKNQSSGIYFYRLKAGSFVESRKMTLIK